MPTHPSSHPFASPDSPGDAQLVLVLLESSPDMLAAWPELQWYLSALLGALQGPDNAVRICWRRTADPAHQRPVFSAAANQVPALRFDATAPLSMAALWSGIETLQAVSRELDERATRHLIVVAVNPPQDPASFHTQAGHTPEAATRDAVIRTLRQERIRLHMVLRQHPRLTALRDFHRQMLQVQISVEAPVWFQVDLRKFTFLLAAKPAALDNAAAQGLVPLPASGPVTPTTTVMTLPTPSPPSASSPRESVPATSPTRRSRAKGKDTAPAAASLDAGGPGLVNYLKQMHGLTKKRNYTAKTTRRNTTGTPGTAEPVRATTSARPILPRLEVPPASTQAETPREHALPHPTIESPTARFQPLVPGLPPDDPRRLANRRWPWLHPTPLGSAPAPGLAPNTDAALRALTHMPPLVPPFGPPAPPQAPSPDAPAPAPSPPYAAAARSLPPSPGYAAYAAADDSENQPFVITTEYEAFANAQFAEAVRSGAMGASMTPPAPPPPHSPQGVYATPEGYAGYAVPFGGAGGAGTQQAQQGEQGGYYRTQGSGAGAGAGAGGQWYGP